MKDTHLEILLVPAFLVVLLAALAFRPTSDGSSSPRDLLRPNDPVGKPAPPRRLTDPEASEKLTGGERRAVPAEQHVEALTNRPPGEAEVAVFVSFGERPGCASTVSVHVGSDQLARREVDRGHVRFDGLPADELLEIRWWSGRLGWERGLLNVHRLTLSPAESASVQLSLDERAHPTGHLELRVLTPTDWTLRDLDLFASKREGPTSLESRLLTAPWTSSRAGRFEASLVRFSPGLWSLEAPGVGFLARFEVLPGATTDLSIDLTNLARVLVHVVDARTGAHLAPATVEWRARTKAGVELPRRAQTTGVGTHLAWMPLGEVEISASRPEGNSASMQRTVLPGTNEFLLELTGSVSPVHELRLGSEGKDVCLSLQDWVQGDFVTLAGEGEVESLQFPSPLDVSNRCSTSALVHVSEAGTYRWLLPANWPTEDRWVDFVVVDGPMTSTDVHLPPSPSSNVDTRGVTGLRPALEKGIAPRPR